MFQKNKSPSANSSYQTLLACLLGFITTTIAAIYLLPTIAPNVGYWNTPTYEPPGEDYFYANAWGEESSHSTLYHDIGRSIGQARQADIIFIGNSRMPLGLREEFILPLAEKAGLNVFSLAVGHGESLEFARRTIIKHGLHPKIVVAVGGPHIYTQWMSKVAKKTILMSQWEAATHRLETTVGWWIKSNLYQVIPRINLPNTRRNTDYVIYRSATSGWWRPVHEPIWQYNVTYEDSPSEHRSILPFVTQFKAELAKHNTLLVSSIVPYGSTADQHLAWLDSELGIPTINPRLPGLKTADGSHLNRASAERVSKEFWAQFINHPKIEKRLEQP